MKALLYIGACCLLLLALKGSAEDTQEEEDYNDFATKTCPFPVLANKSLNMISVGCRQDCNDGVQTLGDGSPCYVIDIGVWKRMTPMYWYSCPLGKCKAGVCKPLGKKEPCLKGEGEQE